LAAVKLICLEFSDPHWIEVVRELANRLPVTVCYWTGTVARRAAVKKHFTSAIFHDNLFAVRGEPAFDWAPSMLTPPDAHLLKKLEAYQVTAMKMMERMDPDRASFSFENRLRHYYRLVEYWYSVLQELRPDAVLMPISPHLVYDYIVYGICQVLGIPTLFFDRTGIPGYVLAVSSISQANAPLSARYAEFLVEDDCPHLSEAMKSHLSQLEGDFSSGMAPNFRLKMERLSMAPKAGGGIQRPGIVQVVRTELRAIVGHVRTQALKAPRNYYVKRGVTPEAGKVGFFEYHFLRWLGIIRKGRLNRFYETLHRVPCGDSPYIFVALHYQPERNTVPIGGIFADQVLIVKLLAAAIPAGWRILVKEHNWQLQPFSRGQISRDEAFYIDMVNIPGVSLVPMETPSFDLIDGSAAVATVAGSVGWEAVNRGKPALVFGEAWYQHCDGVYRISNAQDCHNAITQVIRGASPSRARIRCFLAALECVAVRAVLEPRQEASSGISHDDNVGALTESFRRRLSELPAREVK
jgi:hypothetical protein